jgi:hypothetical protein
MTSMLKVPSSALNVARKPSSADTTVVSTLWNGGRNDATMLGVSMRTLDLN